MSNKAAPHRKFVQTFVLAEQPNGYFVLNDIFRYINEDEEEEPLIEDVAGNPVVAAEPEVETSGLTTSADNIDSEHDLGKSTEKLEEQLQSDTSISDEKETDPGTPNGAVVNDSAETVQAEDVPDISVTASEKEDEAPQEEAPEQASTTEETEPETPQEPEPASVASPPSPKVTPVHASPPAVPPSKPAAPKTWANLVAAHRVVSPAVPNQAPVHATPPVPAQPKAIPPPVARSITPPNSSGEDTQTRNPPNGNAGWQMAGNDYGKRQGRQQSVSGNPEKDTVLGYIKNVTDRVDASLLKTALLEHGKLVYFDVSRQKVTLLLSLCAKHVN